MPLKTYATTFIYAALILPIAINAGPAKADDSLVEAGSYLATVAGCAACHTGPSDQAYAGGRVLHTPFGPLDTPNITQDTATGIGSWTRDDFEGALRRGVNDDGLPLYPGMPYLHYTEITDNDINALWAYVQTIAPISNEVKVNQLPFPYNIRPSLYGWQFIYFKEGRFQPGSSKSDQWNRGAYIIEALAHCGACHTPRDALGGPIRSRALQGAHIEEWYAPDISNREGSVIANWDVDRLTAFLSGNDGLNHVAVGSMSDVITDLSKMRADDVRAIAVYLKDQPQTAGPDDGTPAGVAVTDAMRQSWGELFAANCATCHGTNGTGEAGVAASLVDAGGVIAASPYNVISVLLEGMAPRGDYGIMPSFRDQLSDQQVADLANYVRTAWGNNAPANATADMVVGLRNATRADPGVERAATCPSTPAGRVDDTVRTAVEALAKQSGSLDQSAVASIVTQYNTAHPNATVTQRVTDLGGVFCRDVAATGASRATVVDRQLAFMNAVIAADTQ